MLEYLRRNIARVVIVLACIVMIVGYTMYQNTLDQAQATNNVRNVNITIVHCERVQYAYGPFGISTRSIYLVYGVDENHTYHTYELVDTEERQNTSDWYGQIAGNLNQYGPMEYTLTITGKRIYSESMYPNIIDFSPGNPTSLADNVDIMGDYN